VISPPDVSVARIDVTTSTTTLAPQQTTHMMATARTASGALEHDSTFGL